MSSLHFWKLESIGNDFPLVFITDVPAGLSLSDLALGICDRRFGVGGDGLLAIEKIDEDTLLLRMFNPDGTEDFCGNGIRCAARFVYSEGLFGNAFKILHLGKTIHIEIEGLFVRSEFGAATYDPRLVPLKEGLEEIFSSLVFRNDEIEIKGSAMSTGSTHVVIPVPKLPTDEEIAELGPVIEHFHFYPVRTSVIWRQLVSPEKIKIRIWERGVGETFGCGTGSSAAVVDLFRSEGRGGTVEVENRGGTVSVYTDAWDRPITVEGTAKMVFEGDFDLSLRRR